MSQLFSAQDILPFQHSCRLEQAKPLLITLNTNGTKEQRNGVFPPFRMFPMFRMFRMFRDVCIYASKGPEGP